MGLRLAASVHYHSFFPHFKATFCLHSQLLIHPPWEEEYGFLTNVGSRAQFGLAILLNPNIPAGVLLRLVGIVMILLQFLQEVALICCRGLGQSGGRKINRMLGCGH